MFRFSFVLDHAINIVFTKNYNVIDTETGITSNISNLCFKCKFKIFSQQKTAPLAMVNNVNVDCCNS